MKKAYFYIDDTLWALRDLTRQKPATLFDNPFMKMLKTAHDRYGLKVQLNLFYRTDSFYGYDDFCLADVTDAYKAEFTANADWLKFAFHAMEEFPDYPHVNATYEDTKKLFGMIEKEVFRFAGKESFSYVVCPHWLPMSKGGVKALSDCGVRMVDCTWGNVCEYDGNPDSLPYGHAMRLLNNRQPETKLFTRESRDVAITRSLCGYNHLTPEENEPIYRNSGTVYNRECNILFKVYNSICLNLIPNPDEVMTDLKPFLDGEYIGICDHEQYFYPDYLAYQPDYADKIYKMCEILTEHGFAFVEGAEIIES